VQNQQGKTRLEIATVPLDSGARPELNEASRGRIFADVNGFLDPVSYTHLRAHATKANRGWRVLVEKK
ncbi:Slp family lipoprotein, partial [Raoultella ornithinolytica]|uniref:Slp family lipoprotein n=1 Tax=Raoultella ornithinolytica TaxID=54291 RepID=UPI001D0DBEB5